MKKRPHQTLVLTLVGCLAACGGATPCPVCPPPAPTPAPSASASPAAPQGPSIDGAWHGVLGKLHLALSFTRQGDAYAAVLDSLDQGAKLPVDRVTLDAGKLRFAIASVEGSYEGAVAGDAIHGTWAQHGVAQPLVFDCGEAPPEWTKATAAKPPLDDYVDVRVPEPPSPLHADGKTARLSRFAWLHASCDAGCP